MPVMRRLHGEWEEEDGSPLPELRPGHPMQATYRVRVIVGLRGPRACELLWVKDLRPRDHGVSP